MTSNYPQVSLLLYMIVFSLSFMTRASYLPDKPLLYCPERISYQRKLSDVSEYYQPHSLHPMILRLLHDKQIKVATQFGGGSQYTHNSTELITNSKRLLTGLVCRYRDRVDYSTAVVKFSFSSGLPFRLAGKHSNSFPANKVFCVKLWNAITATTECSKNIVLEPDFHLFVNQLNRNIAHSVQLILVFSRQHQTKMALSKPYAITLDFPFSIYMVADSATHPQEVCSFYSLGKKALKHPALIEIRETLTGLGDYQVHCQAVSNTSRYHQRRPTNNKDSTRSTFFDGINFFTIPNIPKLGQWFNDIPFPDFSQQPPFSQYRQKPGSNWQPYHLEEDELTTAYKTLGLSPGSPQKLVRKKYRNLAKRSHPDKGGNMEAFQRYTKAYETIKQSWQR